ncbi:PTS sugar transporter subunit IIA [Lacticaseibacillus manihotivorans]|uniref:PTS sugar transporter subunit IIA n=1 Tax=Lacticaseibacillus manihotivorans TaxID=88233 RepID=UPI000A49E507|nr:PTS glucose transporter subunit IIA [Lacticaseibacillus manihotivorans]
MPLNEVDDEVFASRAMGDGVAVQPTDGNIYAPVSGEVLTVFPTQHAVGIRTAGGIEVLVHIGINTVDLKGEGFNLTIKQGDHVKAGQQIGTVDLALLQKRGYDTTTMLIVTNMQDAGPFEVVDADNHLYKFNQAPVVQPAQA